MLGGYKSVGSVTDEDRFAGTLAEMLQFVWIGLSCSEHPLAEKGCVASNFAKCGIWSVVVLGLKGFGWSKAVALQVVALGKKWWLWMSGETARGGLLWRCCPELR